MAPVLDSPASPLDDNGPQEPIFVNMEDVQLETPALPQNHISRESSNGFDSQGLRSQRDISPPPSKRRRVHSPFQETPKLSFSLDKPKQKTTENPTVALAKLLGSSSSPKKSATGANQVPLPSSSKRHFAASTVSRLQRISEARTSKGKLNANRPPPKDVSLKIPTAPKAMLQPALESRAAIPTNSSAPERSTGGARSPEPSKAADATFGSHVPSIREVRRKGPDVTSTLPPRPPYFDRQVSDNARPEFPRAMSPVGPTSIYERASSTGITSTSEVSSTDRDPAKCVNCKFPLGQNMTLQCSGCDNKFHKQCSSLSKLLYGQWHCKKCSKRTVQENRSAMPKNPRKKSPSFPTGRPRSFTPIALPSHVAAPVTERNSAPPDVSPPVKTGLLNDSQLLSESDVRPAGNAFAFTSRAASAHVGRPGTRDTLPATESEASMDLSDDEDFQALDLFTSTPMPKTSVMASGDEDTLKPVQQHVLVPDRQQNGYQTGDPIQKPGGTSLSLQTGGVSKPLQRDILPIIPVNGPPPDVLGASVVRGSTAADVTGYSSGQQPHSMGSPMGGVSPSVLTPSREQGLRAAMNMSTSTIIAKGFRRLSTANLESINTTTPTVHTKPSSATSPTTTDTTSANTTPRRVPPGFKIKKRTTLEPETSAKTSGPKSVKPSGVAGWGREFMANGCENPFAEGGARSEKLLYCDEIYQIFGKFPWDLVNRNLRPKRFKVELLKSLTGLKNVLDRFESAGKCLTELEACIITRRAGDSAVGLGAAKLTTGDVQAFTAEVSSRPVFVASEAITATTAALAKKDASSGGPTEAELQQDGTDCIADAESRMARQRDSASDEPPSGTTSGPADGLTSSGLRERARINSLFLDLLSTTPNPGVSRGPTRQTGTEKYGETSKEQGVAKISATVQERAPASTTPRTAARKSAPQNKSNACVPALGEESSATDYSSADEEEGEKPFTEYCPPDLYRLAEETIASGLVKLPRLTYSLTIDDVRNIPIAEVAATIMSLLEVDYGFDPEDELLVGLSQFLESLHFQVLRPPSRTAADPAKVLGDKHHHWLCAARLWAGDAIREQTRAEDIVVRAEHEKRSNVQHDEREVQACNTTLRTIPSSPRQHGGGREHVQAYQRQISDWDLTRKLPFKHLFFKALQDELRARYAVLLRRDTDKSTSSSDVVSMIMSLIAKETLPQPELARENDDAQILIKRLYPMAARRATIMTSYRAGTNTFDTKAALLSAYDVWIRDAVFWALAELRSTCEGEVDTQSARNDKAQARQKLQAEKQKAVPDDSKTINARPGTGDSSQNKRPETELPLVLDSDRSLKVSDDGTKPPFTYAQLIRMAILDAPERRLNLASISDWISSNFSYYKASKNAWRIYVGKALTKYPDFQKQERHESGIGNYWTVVSDVELQLVNEELQHAQAIPQQGVAAVDQSGVGSTTSQALEDEELSGLPDASAKQSINDAEMNDVDDMRQPDIADHGRSDETTYAAYVEDIVDEDDSTDKDMVVPTPGQDGKNDTPVPAEGAQDMMTADQLGPGLASDKPLEVNTADGAFGPSDQLLQELQAGASRAQSHASDLTSELTELENTPEPPAHLLPASKPAAGPRLKLRFSAHENAAKSSNGDGKAAATEMPYTGTSHRPSRGFTPFTYREHILLAVYEEPQRLYGRKAQLPKLTSKEITAFVMEKFPIYSDPANQQQRVMMYNNIAAQCSTHVARGVLAKEMRYDEDLKKHYAVYFAATSSAKFLKAEELQALSDKYRVHLADTFGKSLEGEAAVAMAAEPTRKRPLEIPETPMLKRLKLDSPATTAGAQSTSKLAEPVQAEARTPRSVHTAARKTAAANKPLSAETDREKSPRLPHSASRMAVSSVPSRQSPVLQRALQTSSDRTIPDSDPTRDAALASKATPASSLPERHVLLATGPDPLDEFLSASKVPSSADQELLDLLSSMCEQEAGRDAAKKAEKNFEVTDFFAHWPEHHPRNAVMIDTLSKIEETKTRLNRRQMLGQPYRANDHVRVYRPYDGLDRTATPGSGLNTLIPIGDDIPSRNSSPRKHNNRASPRKRRPVRRDDSNIYADDIDISAILRAEDLPIEEKQVKSWQEAVELPAELELGWMQDVTSRKNQSLVLEPPLAVRGRARIWFKAVLPDG